MIRPTSALARAANRGSWNALVAAATLSALAPMALGDTGTYTVQRGDTLTSVARAYQVPLERLRDLNQLGTSASLLVGQQLRLPERPTTVAPGIYEIKPGDSLSRVAQRFGTTSAALASANGLGAEAVLQIGQRLKVPGESAAPAPLAPLVPSVVQPTVVGPSVLGGRKHSSKSHAGLDNLSRTSAKVDFVAAPGDRVNLRTTAHMESRVVLQAQPGMPLKVVGKAGSWWKVEVPGTGQTAFVAGWVVSPIARDEAKAALAELKSRPQPTEAQADGDEDQPAPKPKKHGKAVMIVASTANVRTNPSTDAERIATVDAGTKMVILESNANWLKVSADNVTGWVAKRLTSAGEQAAKPASKSGDSGSRGGGKVGSTLVQTAMTYLGAPYVRGGTTHDGVDCSGLVVAVAKAHGISLPRTAAGQWDDADQIDRGNLRAGDLVFFKNTYRSGISHVGIYVGNNQFVHAARPGKGVQITDLNDAYYAAHYAGASRIVD